MGGSLSRTSGRKGSARAAELNKYEKLRLNEIATSSEFGGQNINEHCQMVKTPKRNNKYRESK